MLRDAGGRRRGLRAVGPGTRAGATATGLDPLVTPRLFRKRAFTGGLAFGLVFFGALIGTGLVLTFYLQIGLGYSPLKAGLTTLPQALGTVAGFVAAGAAARPRSWAASCCRSARSR